MRSFLDVGKGTAKLMIERLEELGFLDRKKIAALVWLAPFNDDAGKGKRRIWGGRGEVRAMLYIATLSAIRFNPVIKTSYQGLLERGKKKKVAMVACMRKALVILNAMMRDGKSWYCPYEGDLAREKS